MAKRITFNKEQKQKIRYTLMQLFFDVNIMVSKQLPDEEISTYVMNNYFGGYFNDDDVACARWKKECIISNYKDQLERLERMKK